jgi:hypothetical protein
MKGMIRLPVTEAVGGPHFLMPIEYNGKLAVVSPDKL